MNKKEKAMGQIIILSMTILIFFLVYKIGYYIGKDDCLIVIENEVTEIRKVRNDLGDFWEGYCKEDVLLKIHRKLTGKEP